MPTKRKIRKPLNIASGWASRTALMSSVSASAMACVVQFKGTPESEERTLRYAGIRSGVLVAKVQNGKHVLDYA